MTHEIEKAIEWLELSYKIQYRAAEAMMNICPALDCSELYSRCDYYKLAISALREKQERDKGCEHCNKGYYRDLMGTAYSTDKYPFCPKCGRPLGDTP